MRLTFRPIGDDWPGALTGDRKPSPFTAGWKDTKILLEREVDLLANGGRFHAEAVIQLAVPEGAIRQDGQLAGGRSAPEHPGVILSFDCMDGPPLRFSCDRFSPASWKPTLNGWQTNARAIALGLEALRKVERYGMGAGSEQYRGFQALGSGIPMSAAEPEMSRPEAARYLCEASGEVMDSAVTAEVERAYKLAVKAHHPDVGGDPVVFRKLTAARDVLLRN